MELREDRFRHAMLDARAFGVHGGIEQAGERAEQGQRRAEPEARARGDQQGCFSLALATKGPGG